MTTEAVRNRTKTVTRRLGWEFLKPGDILWAVEKGMGLKKGEKVARICQIRVVSTRLESLYALTHGTTYGLDEMEREGFPDLSPVEFVQRFVQRCGRTFRPDLDFVNRIEFEYVEETRCP